MSTCSGRGSWRATGGKPFLISLAAAQPVFRLERWPTLPVRDHGSRASPGIHRATVGLQIIVLAPLKVVDQLLPRSDEADTKGDEVLSFVKLK